MSSTNNGINNNRKKSNSNIEYTGYENMSAFTACPDCSWTVYVPLGQQKAFCKKCGSLASIRRHKSDVEIADEIVALLNLKLYN